MYIRQLFFSNIATPKTAQTNQAQQELFIDVSYMPYQQPKPTQPSPTHWGVHTPYGLEVLDTTIEVRDVHTSSKPEVQKMNDIGTTTRGAHGMKKMRW